MDELQARASPAIDNSLTTPRPSEIEDIKVALADVKSQLGRSSESVLAKLDKLGATMTRYADEEEERETLLSDAFSDTVKRDLHVRSSGIFA